MRSRYRHTKIIFTVGPATKEPAMLEQLVNIGVDVCRLNMAHATHEWTREVLRDLREASARTGREIATMMDVKGPEIRTGFLEDSIELERGDRIDIVIDSEHRNVDGEGVPAIDVNYPGFLGSVQVGQTILVDNGLIRFEVIELLSGRARCEVRIAGSLGSRRHINLPGAKVNLPALTAKDRADIDLGIEEGVNFFALSFVREPDDLEILRRYLSERQSSARIVAKIEDQSAISNLEDIIAAADALMVARGDLGIEIPFENLPLVQRRAVSICQRFGKPVIIATHMLESMIEAPLPTRAEITDIANAVFEMSDCLMLSGETTVGKYPVQCVETMIRVADTVEEACDCKINTSLRLRSPKEKMLRSAAYLAQDLGGIGILVFTRSGHLTRIMSALRPMGCPIFGFTNRRDVFHHMLPLWGVEPFLMEFDDDPECTIRGAYAQLRERDWVKEGDPLVVITNVLAGKRVIDTVQLRHVVASE